MKGRAADLLGPSGPFARALPGYETRPGQLEMASAVEGALEEDALLVVEAGTGTGKTLAYLLPAIASGKRVVVSTATKALEEQIFEHDLPLIEKRLGISVSAALVKGLPNYLCRRRLGELRASPEAMRHRRSLPLVEAWAARTDVGDLAELEGLAEDDPLRREIASSSETRVGAGCAHHAECFVTRLRQRASEARLLVVNHHLFFADLALKSRLARRGAAVTGALPLYDAVVFDEAHQIEEIASEFFGASLSKSRIDALVRDADRALTRAGLARAMTRRGEGTALAASLGAAAEAFFAALAALAARAARASPGGAEAPGEVRAALPREAFRGELSALQGDLEASLRALADHASTATSDEVVQLVATRAREALEALAFIAEAASQSVTWVDLRPRHVAVRATPVDVGETLRRELYDRVGAVVMTSATLSTGPERSFAFLRARLGLEEAPGRPLRELAVDSPFDYASQALLYAPSDLPEVSSPAFFDEAAARVAELVDLTGGGAFLLCTSTRAMRALAERLRASRRSAPGPLFVQGDAPKSALLARFKAEPGSVLVATMSFWEGVDVPGDALRLVIIDRLPFAVPTDPVVAARAAALEAEGHRAFSEYSVPQAAITLKQGFGRLIRTRADRGIVAVLDRRLRTKPYGRRLLASLPPARRASHMDDVRAFWASPAGG